MRRSPVLLPPLLCFLASCGPAPMNAVCPNFPASGQCDGDSVRWCDGASTDGQPPASFSCGAIGATCATDATFGAWCAGGPGTKCTVDAQGRSGYLMCGDANGPSAQLACDLEHGCVTGPGACTPGMMTAPTCQGDVLVVDCTPWGQPVIHDCKALGGTGCANGVCVGASSGGDCSETVACANGFKCDLMSKKCVFAPAMHPAMPQVLNLGGPVLSHPKVLPISWMTDPQAVNLDKAVEELAGVSASTWAAMTSEYGVGALTAVTPVHLNETIPASFTDAQFTAMIKMNTGGTTPAWGALDPDTIYLLSIPQGVDFDDGTGSRCCSDWDGYHYDSVSGSTHFSYAVVCTCPGFDGPQESTKDQLTTVVSHELVEAATDPLSSRPAFAQTDDDHAVWTVTSSGELADMCEFLDDSSYLPAGATTKVQRSWSNKAAAMGLNPCVPAGPFFGTEPILPATGTIKYSGQWMTKVVKIAAGQTGVVDLPMFSSEAMAPWQVTALDFSADIMNGPRLLTLHLDKGTAQNGDVLHLSITPSSFDTTLGGAVFFVKSTTPTDETLTMGVVVAP